MYGSFLFSFIGRGVFYTVVAVTINGASVFRLLAALVIFLVGTVYVGLEAVPSILPPDNMNLEGVAINDDEII